MLFKSFSHSEQQSKNGVVIYHSKLFLIILSVTAKLSPLWILLRQRSRNHLIETVFPWRRKWQPTPVFLPGKIPWTMKKIPVGYSTWGHKRVRLDLTTK